MKALLLMSTRGLFGAENAVLELTKQLPSYGFEPLIGILENSESMHVAFEEEAEKLGLSVTIFRCKGKFDIRTVFELRKYVKENKIILIHSHGYKSNFYSLLCSINTKIKRIATCHNWLGGGVKMRFYESLDKFLLKRFDKVVAVSDLLKEEIINSKISKEKVVVISNGIDIGRFGVLASGSRLRIKQALGIKESDKVMGTISRLSIEKGHDCLLKAFAKIALKFPDVKLVIVGDGPLLSSLRLQAASLKLGDKVIFTGIRNDIPEILGMMDIFVLPSLVEGMPMVLLEAMAAQKPIVATKVGAVPKLIEHNKTGLLIEPKDPDSIYASIAVLLQDKEKAKLVSLNAFERVKNEFSSSLMAQKYSAVYKEITNNHKRLNQW